MPRRLSIDRPVSRHAALRQHDARQPVHDGSSVVIADVLGSWDVQRTANQAGRMGGFVLQGSG